MYLHNGYNSMHVDVQSTIYPLPFVFILAHTICVILSVGVLPSCFFMQAMRESRLALSYGLEDRILLEAAQEIPYPDLQHLDAVLRELYQTILDQTRLYQTILDYTRLYQTILDYTRLYQTILDYTRLYQTILDYTRLYQTILDYTLIY